MKDASLVLSCPSKVNLALAVGPPNAARDGMHPIASWMITTRFADTLEIRPTDDRSTFDIAFADDAPHRQPIDWRLESDLAFRAHALLQEHVGRALPVAVTLRKRIPAGAGLGGGSANAAGMLIALNRLFDLDVGVEQLVRLAGRLGSDVMFLVRAIAGEPSCIVSGFGDVIEPAPRSQSIPLVLIFPPFGCPTGPVYRAFDETLDAAAHRLRHGRVVALSQQDPVPQDGPFNDLAEPAMHVEPALRALYAQLREQMQLPVHVSGSGSTLYLIAPSALTADVLARRVQTEAAVPAVSTRTTV